MAYLKLYGGATYHVAGVDEGVCANDTNFKQSFEQTKLAFYPWREKTKLLANFNGHLAGSNFDGGFSDVKNFKLYKTIGKSQKLHKVYETENSYQRIIEDFTIGDLCDYQYYLYPVCKNQTQVNGNDIEVETIYPIEMKPFQIHNGTIVVAGLVKDESSENSYRIDENNVWHLQLNVKNEGYTLNTDKTFYQTQNVYGKSTGGNRKQRTIPISGLLGKINCETQQYEDCYDYIVEWENFASSNCLKMLIDLRGIITIGDIEINPSFVYDTTPNKSVSVSFDFIQLNSLDNIDVLGRHLYVNPLYYMLLEESDDLLLRDALVEDENYIPNKYLSSPLKEVSS